MERLVLVHGSVVGGRATWAAERRGLRGRFDLLVVERPGFPPGPPLARLDFDEQADWLAARLGAGDHLVGHSYGGVVSLLAAARASSPLGSLTVLEPPAAAVARGHPAVERFVREGAAWWRDGPRDDPEAFLRGFLRFVGSDYEPPSPLPPDLVQGARLLVVERSPWEAEIPLAGLAAAPYPKLVVSGAHDAAFDAICDALVRGLGAERLVLAGYGHNPQRHPGFDQALTDFVARGARARRAG